MSEQAKENEEYPHAGGFGRLPMVEQHVGVRQLVGVSQLVVIQ